MKKEALKLFENIILEINKNSGKSHASLRDSAVDYGRIAGLSEEEIKRNLNVAGVNNLDIEGSTGRQEGD